MLCDGRLVSHDHLPTVSFLKHVCALEGMDDIDWLHPCGSHNICHRRGRHSRWHARADEQGNEPAQGRASRLAVIDLSQAEETRDNTG